MVVDMNTARYRFLQIKGVSYFLTNIDLSKYHQKYWLQDLKFVKLCHVEHSIFNVLQRYSQMYTHVYLVESTKTNLSQKIKGRFIIKELNIIKDLPRFSSHRRLKVFNYKGLLCSNPNCKKKGEYLLMTLKNGGIHLDVFTKDLELMTVDHILPKSLGGLMTLDNLRPMCETCNQRRGNDVNYEY